MRRIFRPIAAALFFAAVAVAATSCAANRATPAIEYTLTPTQEDIRTCAVIVPQNADVCDPDGDIANGDYDAANAAE